MIVLLKRKHFLTTIGLSALQILKHKRMKKYDFNKRFEISSITGLMSRTYYGVNI